jgi:hypothetical protein
VASYVVKNVGYFMLAANAEGWLSFAYRKVGAKGTDIRCQELADGDDAAKLMHFTMRWS